MKSRGTRTTFLILLVSVILCAHLLAGEETDKPKIVGQLVSATDDISISGLPGLIGTTILTGDKLSTGVNPAVIALTDGSRIYIVSESQVTFSFSSGGVVFTDTVGEVVSKASPEFEYTEAAIVQLSKKGKKGKKGRKGSPKKPPYGPPHKPPGPPKKRPPHTPPGPPGERFQPPGHERNAPPGQSKKDQP